QPSLATRLEMEAPRRRRQGQEQKPHAAPGGLDREHRKPDQGDRLPKRRPVPDREHEKNDCRSNEKEVEAGGEREWLPEPFTASGRLVLEQSGVVLRRVL